MMHPMLPMSSEDVDEGLKWLTATTQNTKIFILTTMRTSNHTQSTTVSKNNSAENM
jgi:hypothetical protein